MIRSGLIIVAVAAVLLTGAAGAANLVPHRALYVLSLDKADRGSQVASVSGEMGVDWSRSCAGWTFEHRSLMDVAFAERRPIRLVTNAATWESADGREFRFTVRNLTDGRIAETIEGTAHMAKSGAAGQIQFTAPKRKRMSLPVGTLFPIAHAVAVIDAADRSATMLTRHVFDGMGFDGAFEVSAVLGAPRMSVVQHFPGAQARAHRRHFPVQLAYFKAADPAGLPVHEVGMHLFDDGIADQLLMRFDDFIVRARLDRLELEAPPDCGG